MKDIYPDGGGTDDTEEQLPNPSLIEGGGVGGPALAGRLNVYVRGEADGGGVYGATVTVACGDAVLSAETDAEGLVTIDDPGLEGTADVHVRVSGYALESVYGVAAANVTIPVIPTVEADADQVVISGTVSGIESIQEPGSNEVRAVIVGWGPPVSAMAALKTMGMTLPDIPRVMIEVPSGDEVDFELTVPAGTGCLFVNGGIYMTFGTAETDDDMFRGKYIGAMTGMEASGDAMADLDVDLDTPLSSTVLMGTTYTALPDAYDEQVPLFGLDFGEDGTLWFEGADAGNYIFSAPLYISPWTAGAILVVNTAGVVVEDGETALGSDRPEGFNLDRSVTSYEDYAVETFGPQSAPSPPTILGWTGAAISSLPPPSATMGRALVTTEAGENLWRATVLSSLPISIEIPDAVFDDGMEALPASGVYVELSSSSLDGLDMDDFRYQDYPEALTDVSVGGVFFE